ncbi:TspO/MBR family protein [Sandarakinorhabdus sp.]|uniref:TspO/MBR family protein n=1 Tax=Sandarakinorhabdus sp. TaxID=1916663 RepID=UPI00286DCEAC|nr:TspO/MBR family protein [Sandarakinorhabdus sp.]
MLAGRWILPAFIAAIAASLTAAVGATITDLGPWYQGLNQPSWAPPNWLFGPAWTVLFLLCTISGTTAWLAARTRSGGDAIIGMFALNGFLNLMWSFLFFRWHRPDLAAIEIGLLWASIAALIVVTWRVSRTASLLLVPYLAWVSFAAMLNRAIVTLN